MLAQTNSSKKKLALSAIVIVAVLAIVFLAVRETAATPGSGVTPEPIVASELTESVRAKFKEDASGFGEGTEVVSLTLVKFTIAPGGIFGWHRHGGPVWAMVSSGTLTIYDGDDPTCTGTIYTAGSAFLDPGDHTHNARNEGSENVVIYATFMLPEGGAPRIDAPDPGVCPF